ncbi:MAG: glycosyltransferase family 2 protein [Gemmataceae bacterium]
MSPRLSIVIPTHQRTDLLSCCLSSVIRYRPSDTQVLVVDDGSPDARASRTAEAFGVEAVRLPAPRGFCVAANVGVAHSRGEVVALLNDDTEVTAGWADAALAPFADPTVAAVTPLVLLGPPGVHQPERIDSAGDGYSVGGVAYKRGHRQPLAADYLEPRPVFGASGSGSFFRRAAYLAAGGMPEEFGAYFDDVDLSFRLHHAGYTVRFEPASRIYHRVSSSYGRPSARLLRLQSRNEELVFWRNLPAGDLVRALPFHLAVLLGKAVRRMREGGLLPWLAGRLEVLGWVGAICRHRRRHLQAHRPVGTWGVGWRLPVRRSAAA